MINFNCNKQYLLSRDKRLSQKKNDKEMIYWIYVFRDGDTNRFAKFTHFEDGEIIDENGEQVKYDIPYIINGFVNTPPNSIYLNISSIKKDKKTIKILQEKSQNW